MNENNPAFDPLPYHRVEPIAKFPTPVIGLCVFKDRLFVATKEAVFERMEDGSFHEVRLIKAGDAP